MLLLFDIGNTNTVIGLYDEENLIHHWRIRSDQEKTADEYSVLLTQLLAQKKTAPENITGIAMASVVPPLLPVLTRTVQTTFGLQPHILNATSVTDLTILYEHPRDVGADRIANALAVKGKYPLPAIVVDFGTATTFDCISEKGEYLGGVICPGVEISMEALFSKASKLPPVSLKYPLSPLGTNTVSSIQAGIMYGTIGEVETIVTALRNVMEGDPTVIATGGLASKIGRHCHCVDVIDELLTLEGLKIFFNRLIVDEKPSHVAD